MTLPTRLLQRAAWAAAIASALLLPAVLRAQTATSASAADDTASSEAEVAYAVHDLDWLDAKRRRAVPARLYLPESADPARPVPLVVFSHGIGGSRMGYSYLGRYWASQGFASLHLQHVGSDRSLWSGSPISLVYRLREAAQETEAVARVADLHFALDELLAGPYAKRVDATRIVAAGHSYGANTTLLAVGARVEREGRPLELRDARIKAAIVLSAPPFYGESDARRILQQVSVPTLHVTCTEDVIRIPGYYSGAEDRIAVFEATGSADKALAVFAGGSHSMFTDRSGTGGATLNPQVKEATRRLSLAFLKRVFNNDATALARWPAENAAIVARFTRLGL